jgi:hypothetical protein
VAKWSGVSPLSENDGSIVLYSAAMKWSLSLFIFTILALIGLTIFEKSRLLGLSVEYPAPPAPEIHTQNSLTTIPSPKELSGPIHDDFQDVYFQSLKFSITTDERPFYFRVGSTLVLGITALILLVSKRRQPKDKHWLYATLGMLVGYWLRG